jgi:integrase
MGPKGEEMLQHTLGHVDCPVCDQELERALEETDLTQLPFARAFEHWLTEHSRYIKPNTIRSYNCCRKPLLAFFGEMTTGKIHIGNIRRYQDERGERAGAYRINGELSALQQVLKEAGCWKAIAELYRPLPVPKSRSGHSISAEEEQRLREIAMQQPKWRLAAHCMTVMLSTTMGFGELRHIRRRDVDMRKGCLTVRDGAKNDFRDRTIPLNTAAYDSLSWILERWEKLGGSDPMEFILPHRPRGLGKPWIFDEPMTAITTAFRKIRKAAGLSHFRVYDCRVQAITKLLSNPAVSPQVAKEIAGHISQAMQDRYSIQQFDTKLAALEALEAPRKPVQKVLEIPLDSYVKQAYGKHTDEDLQRRRRS